MISAKDRSEALETQGAAFRSEAALDHLRAATFFLERDGEVLYANKAAAVLIGCRDGVSLIRGRFVCEDLPCQARVAALFALAAMTGDRSGGAALIPRPSGRSSYRIQVTRVRRSGVGGFECGLVLAFVTDPEQATVLSSVTLRQLYRLSQAETEIVNGLLAGMRLEQIAETRRVTVGTVRIQVKSIFSKTGAQSQSDLLRLLLSLHSCM